MYPFVSTLFRLYTLDIGNGRHSTLNSNSNIFLTCFDSLEPGQHWILISRMFVVKVDIL